MPRVKKTPTCLRKGCPNVRTGWNDCCSEDCTKIRQQSLREDQTKAQQKEQDKIDADAKAWATSSLDIDAKVKAWLQLPLLVRDKAEELVTSRRDLINAMHKAKAEARAQANKDDVKRAMRPV